ncbi:MAG TPA: protein-tyrosine phosphatase family protein [Labilithrix sp.]|nr:protein-tyrosine phosphatase family protein [Labilithrix sp.]
MKTSSKTFALLATLSLAACSLAACSAEVPDEEVGTSDQNLDICKDIVLPIIAPGVHPAADCPAGSACAPSQFEAVTPKGGGKVSVYRGGHPKNDGMMDYLANAGVTSIVTLEMPATTLQGKVESLCQHDSIPDEAGRAKARGMSFFPLGFDPTKEVVDLERTGKGTARGCTDAASLADDGAACHAVMDEQVAAALDKMKEATPTSPVYLHCTLGVDRTGLLIALHRVRNEGWSARDAATEWSNHLYGSASWTPGRSRCQEFRTLDITFNRWVKKVSPRDTFRLDPDAPHCGL